jgi:serine/threonine-protein kinase HipA
MKNAYPGIKTETKNVELINSFGFESLGVHRLPSEAWWANYYDPLRGKMKEFEDSTDGVMQAVLRDTEEEMAFFKEHHEDYGYTFYIMRAI